MPDGNGDEEGMSEMGMELGGLIVQFHILFSQFE